MTGSARWVVRRLLGAVPLVFGVTLVSFVLMVHFGPDPVYERLSKNPTQDEISALRSELGHDLPFWHRYGLYLRQLATLELGHSDSSGERVESILARTVPVTLALVLPGFVLGNLLALALALLAAWHHGRWPDRLITTLAVVGMSISFLVVIIGLQLIFGVVLGWLPVRGWDVHDLPSYLNHVALPTLALILVSLGYNTRFFRAVMVEEMTRDHVRTARAFGATRMDILLQNVLRNAWMPVITRVLFSLPLLVVSGSLLIETYFGVPGVGKVVFDAVVTGDQPVLKAVVPLTALAFVLILLLSDVLYRWADPRVTSA